MNLRLCCVCANQLSNVLVEKIDEKKNKRKKSSTRWFDITTNLYSPTLHVGQTWVLINKVSQSQIDIDYIDIAGRESLSILQVGQLGLVTHIEKNSFCVATIRFDLKDRIFCNSFELTRLPQTNDSQFFLPYQKSDSDKCF